MVGHRYISSTEKYLQNDIKGLKEVIESFHPIN
jgi:integrase/recombinase XerD